MHRLNFDSCPADPDVWMIPAIEADGLEYHEYVLLYKDNMIVISENGNYLLRE